MLIQYSNPNVATSSANSTDRCAFTCGAKPLSRSHGWMAPSSTCTAKLRTMVSMSTPVSQSAIRLSAGS